MGNIELIVENNLSLEDENILKSIVNIKYNVK